MSFSPRGCAPRHAERQTEDSPALKPGSFERPYPPHNMWNPSNSDLSDGIRPFKFESPSPTKFRRFSRRLSGEESCESDLISLDGESRFRNYTRQSALSSYSSDFARNEQFAEYSQNHDPRFPRDTTYSSGFNNQHIKEPLHRNSRSCGVINQDHFYGSHCTKNHQKALHAWSPHGSSTLRSSRSEKQSHRKEHHRLSEPPSYRSDVRVDMNSPGKPLESIQNGSPAKRFSSPVKPLQASKCNKTSILGKLLAESPTKTSSSYKKRDHLKYFSCQGMEEDRLFKKLSPNTRKNEGNALIKILDRKYRKKRKKKKNKDKRKSRSRSEERQRGIPDKVYKKEESQVGNAHLTALSPSKVNSTTASCSSGVKRGREAQTLDSHIVPRSNKLVSTETPDSYICAIVKKRRTSTQDDEGSAVLKFTRVEGRCRKPASPRKSGLAGSMEQGQDSTPTSAKKTERSSASIEAVTPPSESEVVVKQNATRSSPTKGDLKPKAIIKPGLRSAKKETKSVHEPKRRSKSPQKPEKEDSGPRMVQKTLESYFRKSVSEAKTKVQAEETEPTEAVCSVDITKSADQGNSKSHGDEAESTSRAVVQLTPISEVVISKLRSPKTAADSAPRRWGSTPRLAEVRPILSPAKKRPESPPPADLAKGASRALRVTRTASMESAAPDQPDQPLGDQPLDVLLPEEDLAQAERDQAAREAEVTKAAQRNRKRHTRGHKVFAFCDVLQEHIERHPVQNEIPANKWSKWLNPAQSRCLVSAMLDNTDLCLNFSLDAERNEEWEEYWVKLARRLNNVCFNDLTNLNTGLRMTVFEWKTCWLDLKKTVKTRVDAMTAKERNHNLGSLDCLLFSKDLFTKLINSNGDCLGEGCPKIWCPGACVGVFCPEPVRIRSTEE
ncbi:uncharacterized protein LOC117641601 [Thrips palmi]|uniref:Uncharacterized protein LOC117641601 n=1 Tax=Thrips palmi TaxID=161013 RepID=A0A6P8YDJ7_THRPL|nr:uncharacterized protein LOC117641601 [Thrips palmi]XP_034234956.1 uncharacterized protein LOC117641601 [Thrips palmi]